MVVVFDNSKWRYQWCLHKCQQCVFETVRTNNWKMHRFTTIQKLWAKLHFLTKWTLLLIHSEDLSLISLLLYEGQSTKLLIYLHTYLSEGIKNIKPVVFTLNACVFTIINNLYKYRQYLSLAGRFSRVFRNFCN